MKPGLHTMDSEEYHADPCPAPSLSASILHLLCARSPRHAWTAHPRLNPDYQREEENKFDLGTAAHAFILERHGSGRFAIVDAPDWRTKDAQTLRVAARMAGKTPLLRAQWEQVKALASALGLSLSRLEPPRPFTQPGGQPEQTLIWKEDGIWCRARLDWLHDDHRMIDDLKTTAASANPSAFSRMLFSMGYDIQARWYQRGVQAVLGKAARFRFIPVEIDPPYACSAVSLGPEAEALADQKIAYGLKVWRECLATDTWPGYPTATAYADPPAWEVMAWSERQYRDEGGVVDDGRPLGELLS